MSTIARALGVSRSNLYEQLNPKVKPKPCYGDEADLGAIRSITDERPSYGYRRVTAMLRRTQSRIVNHKRVYRIMRENGLALPCFGRRPSRRHDGKVITLHSNTRWCSDGFRIQCFNGEHVEVAFSLDCCDREVLSGVSSTRGIDGGLIRDLMLQSIEYRFKGLGVFGKHIQWLSDNGPGYTANETVKFGRELGFEVITTPSYSPQSNGMAEAFVKTFKRDYVCHADLSSAQRVIEQLDGWFEDYNTMHPHKGLGMLSPRQYLKQNAF
jgi:putative transposase